MKVPLPEIEQHLMEQLGFVSSSCLEFDNGKFHEAKRISVALRIILHDTSKSKSLLRQLTLDQRPMLDTSAPLVMGEILGRTALVGTYLGGQSGSGFFAPLDDSIRKSSIPFPNWWKQVVLDDQRGRQLSRKGLITTMANKDGGAHVDSDIDDTYHRIKEDSLGYRFGSLDNVYISKNLHYFTIRQIAHEVLRSFGIDYEIPRSPLLPEFQMQGFNAFDGTVLVEPPRNSPCPCKSELKYKNCHGRLGDPAFSSTPS